MRTTKYLVLPVLSCAFLASTTKTSAEVLKVEGSVRTTILQYIGDANPNEIDDNSEIVPDTKSELPITARSSLDRLNTDGATSAAALAFATLESPDFANPNDVGLDLTAFSDDDVTSWRLESIVTETRELSLSALDLGATENMPPASRAHSSVFLSGVMVLEALSKSTDLSGSEVNLTVSVTHHRPDRPSVSVVAGEVALVGHANGEVSIGRAAGVFEGLILPVIEIEIPTDSTPVARAVIFAGVEFPYEFDVSPGEQFKLDLSVRSQVITQPGGIGASATFGVPQKAIGEIFQRVKGDNTGQTLADMISQHVDTTGESYANNPTPLPLFGICGASGVEIPLLAAGMGMLSINRCRRRLRR